MLPVVSEFRPETHEASSGLFNDEFVVDGALRIGYVLGTSSDVANIRVVKRYFRYLNSDDWQGLGTIWHKDAELCAVGARRRTGVDEIVTYYQKIFSLWNTHVDRPTRFLVSGNAVTVEVAFTGTTPSGRCVEFDAVDVIDIIDGRISKLSSWYDIAYARLQLAQ